MINSLIYSGRLHTLIFKILLWLCLIVTCFAHGKQVTLCITSVPPYFYQKTPADKLQGIGIEIINQIFIPLKDIEVKVELLPWKRCQNEAAKGQFDGVAILAQSAQRAKHFIFSETLFISEGGVFVRAENVAAINEINDLKKYRIGFIRGSRISQYIEGLANKKIVFDVTRATSVQQLVSLVEKKRIDIMLLEKRVGVEILTRFNLKHLIKPVAIKYYQFTYSIGISKKSILQQELKTINHMIMTLKSKKMIEQILYQQN